MSPEQALGRRGALDGRTDIYSLGATLYELLTLRPAFDGDDRCELLRQIAQDEPMPPRKLDPAIPVDLETIVLKAMAKEPADRYRHGRRAGRRPRPVPRRPADPRPPAEPRRPGCEMGATASRTGRDRDGGADDFPHGPRGVVLQYDAWLRRYNAALRPRQTGRTERTRSRASRE